MKSNKEQDLTKKVSFDFIRYANCWEDADVLLKGLNPQRGEKILSIASAGDNSFALLMNDPEIVVAVDVNPIQLHLVELKKAAIKVLSREEVLRFLGFQNSPDRKEKYSVIRFELSENDKLYWDENLDQIERGIIHEGKFEKYFQFFSRKILPWIHSRKTIEELFSKKSEKEQITFYETKWNNWRWRLLFKIFFSKLVMGRKGRDPEFLKQVNVKVSDYIFSKAEMQLKSIAAQDNFILRYNLTASFAHLLPFYLQEENFLKIKQNIDRLKTVEGFAQDAIKHYGKFDKMNLSDIFEYLNPEQFELLANELKEGMNTEGRLAYWNLMVPRKLSDVSPGNFMFRNESLKISESDKGFFYRQFIVDEVK